MKFVIRVCRACGRDEFQIGAVSHAGFCEDCGIRRAVEAAVQMSDKRGPFWDEWLDKMDAFISEARGEGGTSA